MLPSIDLRIATLIKALEQVILPALPPRERLAKEQVMLVIGHLGLIGSQWKNAIAFEVGSLEALLRLAHDLKDDAGGEAEALACAIAKAEAADLSDLGAVEIAYRELGAIIDRIILGEDGTLPLSRGAIDAVIAQGAVQARRERTWFAGNGLDPDVRELPQISDILDEERSRRN